MKQFNLNHSETTGVLVAVPKTFLDEIFGNQNRIIQLLENKDSKPEGIGDYITEVEAQKVLGRKPSWFWGMRTRGKLPYTKIGNKVFYSRSDILKLLDSKKQNGFPTRK